MGRRCGRGEGRQRKERREQSKCNSHYTILEAHHPTMKLQTTFYLPPLQCSALSFSPSLFFFVLDTWQTISVLVALKLEQLCFFEIQKTIRASQMSVNFLVSRLLSLHACMFARLLACMAYLYIVIPKLVVSNCQHLIFFRCNLSNKQFHQVSSRKHQEVIARIWNRKERE